MAPCELCPWGSAFPEWLQFSSFFCTLCPFVPDVPLALKMRVWLRGFDLVIGFVPRKPFAGYSVRITCDRLELYPPVKPYGAENAFTGPGAFSLV
jgi:hypothetical protein